MIIPTIRVLHDMEIAAELRAAGATWETVAGCLGRHPNLLIRWSSTYARDWEELLAEANARLAGVCDQRQRAVLRRLMRHPSARVRLRAAERIANQRRDAMADKPAPDPLRSAADFLAVVDRLSYEEFNRCLDEFLDRHKEGPKRDA